MCLLFYYDVIGLCPKKVTEKKKTIPKPNLKELAFFKEAEKFITRESERTGKTQEQIIEETFGNGFIVVSEVAGEGSFKVESGQLFKSAADKGDDLTECRRLRERFGPIAACVDYIIDQIMGSGIEPIIDDLKDPHQKEVKDRLQIWMKDILYQDIYTVGLNTLLRTLVDNALTDGYAAAEIVYVTSPKKNSFWDDYAKPIESTVISSQSGKLAKSDYTSYEIIDPDWKDLKGISRLKIILDATTRLTLYRRTQSWEANYWVLDEPSTSGVQTGMNTASQKNLQQNSSMQITKEELMSQSMNLKKGPIKKPAAYFLPWQIFSLSLTRRNWLEKGPSIILPALKTAKLLEQIMSAVGEGIYRAGNKKYFIVCGTQDRPWGPVHIRNLLSMLKDASEKNWSTVPVPAGFDLKEAGGTVFEAQNAINYFLRVIAGEMHVNPSVLGLDTRQARNITEYPYFTHTQLKESLLNQIRTQLIRLHLWTIYGQQKKKQGKENFEPQWIPDIRSKVEDLLNPADRLKLDLDILNAANPVMPQTKLEVERDIVKTRGWEVILPTQEEFMTELDKQKKQQEEMQAAQLEMAKNQNKEQGKPEAPSVEKQQKRQDNGVNVKKTQSGDQAQSNPNMGSTRVPKEAKKTIQEALENAELPKTTTIGDTFTVVNPFGIGSRQLKREDGSQVFASEIITIVITPLEDSAARYNKDLTKIYIDPFVPVEFYRLVIAHEIYEYLLQQISGKSFAESEKLANGLEDFLCKNMSLNPKIYQRKMADVMEQIDARNKQTPVKNPDDVVYHKELEETVPTQRVELVIKNEPQKVQVELKEDEEKKAADKELTKTKLENEKQKKKLLEKIEKDVDKDSE